MRYKILNILALVTLASCTETIYIEKDAEKSPYLNGECKTPIAVGISYDEGSVQTRATRAANGSFTSGDNLIACFRHVTATETNGTFTDITAVSGTGIGPAKANMTIGSIVENSEAKADNYTGSTITTLTLSPTLYWDDFSNSANASTDLRTSGHYLQSYYGYCYNGKTGVTESETEPTTGTWLKPSTGELTGWTIETDQNTNGLTKSDLLWSSSQDPVAYKHATFNGGVEHGEMKVPYSHAMSKVTIEVNLADGFGDVVATNFPTSSKITLNAQTKCSVSAPATTDFPKGKVTPSTTSEDVTGITMKKGTPTDDGKSCTFEAIIAPTVLKPVADVTTAPSTAAFATIEGIDGNKYDIFLTDEIMRPLQADNSTPKTDAWSTKLAASGAASVGPESSGYTAANGGTTIPGVNYKLVVTISKQEIKVVATIADWTNVEASAKGEIYFTTDIAGPDENTFETTFDLYSKSAVTTTETYNNLTTNNRNTVCTWDGTNRKWTYAPTLYWEKEGDNRYFRAVSPQVNNRTITSIDDSQTVKMTAGEGTDFDFCWGTSQAYTKKDGTTVVEEGGIVEPRTSNVGLQFYHKTSKVKIVLQTPPTDAEGKVAIKDAQIQLTNLYTTNTVNLHSGVISAFTESSSRSAKVFTESATASDDKRPKASNYAAGSAATESSAAVDDKAETAELFMIPQEIPSDKASTDDKNEESRLIITLADGTTYSLALNSCKTVVKDENGDDQYIPVDKWEEGKSYVYYIRLTKEEIQFIALIQNWEEKETSGSATMDWNDVDPDLFEGGLIEKRGDGWR